jgi:hypothetical protein
LRCVTSGEQQPQHWQQQHTQQLSFPQCTT